MFSQPFELSRTDLVEPAVLDHAFDRAVAIQNRSSIGINILAANSVLLGLDESWLRKVINLFGQAWVVGIDPNKKHLGFVVLLQIIVDRSEIEKHIERRLRLGSPNVRGGLVSN